MCRKHGREKEYIFLKSSFSCKFTANSGRTLEGQSVMEKERRNGGKNKKRRNGDSGQRLCPPELTPRSAQGKCWRPGATGRRVLYVS